VSHVISAVPLSRRDFLRIVAMAGGGAAIGAAASIAPRGQVAATAGGLVMGTVAHLTVYADDRAAAQSLADGALAEMRRLETLLTRFDTTAPGVENVRYLNEHRAIPLPTPELASVAAAALRWASLSRGAFDPTVLPALDSAREAAPGAHRMDAIREAVGYRHLVVGDGVRLTHPKSALTLDGIAAGYVIDGAVAHLRGAGLDDVMVEAGGEVATTGMKPGRAHWRVGVQDPRSKGLVMTIDLDGRAVATSGDYVNSYTPDLSRHHLIDPTTCRPALASSSATVIAPDCMSADALSTTAFVLGPRDGIDLLETLPGVEGLVIDREGRMARTAGFEAK
jgi:thiamine biosynthesis lipoprotein